MNSPAASPTPSKERRLKVLLVDDASAVRQELRQLLQLTDLIEVVGEAEDGLQAVHQTTELTPDVVVLDLVMPHLGGMEAARQIKSQCKPPRVVILSVHGGPVELGRAQAAGADDFVIKGADLQTLLNAILGQGG